MISQNRFEDLFGNRQYLTLKNHLYNYRLRKRAVEKALGDEEMTLTLEVGSGISPVVTFTDRVVYTDLSFAAVSILRQSGQKGWYVVADAMKLPFKGASFSHVVASEVLEHLPDDHGALQEAAAVLKRPGRLIVTFPHRRFYFALDDAYVGHFRRYELDEMSSRLKEVGLYPVAVRKVLGPLEKVTMMAAAGCLSLVRKLRSRQDVSIESLKGLDRIAPFFKWANRLYAALVWLDAGIMPRSLSSVLLIKAEKGK
jgi:SAM-dependent methyltransferase